MNRSPAFQFYPKDWFDYRVRRMSKEARGCYIDLLAYIWKDTKTQYCIKNDLRSMKKILNLTPKRFKKVWAEIQWEGDPIFETDNGFLVSNRLKKEKLKQDENRRKRQEAAKKRWDKS